MPILLLFLLLPLVEIALFVLVGDWLGLWPTLGLVVAAVLAGGLLIRRQGLAAVREIQRAQGGAVMPGAPVAHGALIVLAGLLLILPGFFSDAMGLLLLVPAVRRLLIDRFSARIVVAGAAARQQRQWPGAHEDVIDAEAVEIDPDARPLPGARPSGWTRPPR